LIPREENQSRVVHADDERELESQSLEVNILV